MARSTTRKRVKPATYEPGSGGGSAKKPKPAVAVATAAASVVRSGPLEVDDAASDSATAGDSAISYPMVVPGAKDGQNGLAEGSLSLLENGSLSIDAEMEDKGATRSPPKKPVVKRSKVATANGKSKSKPKATGKRTPAVKTKTKTPAKRKVRSQEDKVRENAPVATPFFTETGVEWNNTDIDFDELSTLRGLWELPAACHLLWLLQSPLTLRFSNTLLEYEAALLKPEDSPVLEDVFTKLLLKRSERACLSAGIGLKYEWWNKQLRLYYLDMYDKWYALLRKAGERLPETFSQDEDDDDSSTSDSKSDQQVDVELSDDEWMTLDILKARLETLGMVCPLKHQSFADLTVELRCKILLNLCEAVVDDPVNTDYMRQMEEDDLRVEPLGNDRAGNLFYFFPQFYEERRLYRLDAATQQWALWAKGDEAFRAMLAAMKEIRGRKVRGEQELLDHLEVIVEQIEDDDSARVRQTEKANRLAILEAIPRKRSLRLQVKQLEKMEQHQEELAHKQELSMEELADLRRAELLQKVEREAEKEARDAEREARRLHREEQEREAALADRDLRRQRRLEKEKQDEELEQQLEAEKRKQEEAREHRARQRHALEEQQREEEEAQSAVAAATAAAQGQDQSPAPTANGTGTGNGTSA